MKPMKRKFIPSFDSVFGDQKRYKTENSQEKMPGQINYPLGWNLRIDYQERAACSTSTQDSALNSVHYPDYSKQSFADINNSKRNLQSNKDSRIKVKVRRNQPIKNNEFYANQSNNSSYSTSTDKSNQFVSRSFSSSNAFINKSQRELTIPRPFNLSADNHTKHNCSFEESFEFIAREMPDFSIPFQVKPCEKPYTKPLNFFLSTEIRADQRDIFNEKIKEKERKNYFERKYEIEEREKREKEEIRIIRKQMEFKASPFINSGPFVLKPSQIPSTIPYPPQLMTDARSYYRGFNN